MMMEAQVAGTNVPDAKVDELDEDLTEAVLHLASKGALRLVDQDLKKFFPADNQEVYLQKLVDAGYLEKTGKKSAIRYKILQKGAEFIVLSKAPEPVKTSDVVKAPDVIKAPEVVPQQVKDDWQKLMNYDGRLDASVRTIGLAIGCKIRFDKKEKRNKFSENDMDRIVTLRRVARKNRLLRRIPVNDSDGKLIKYNYDFAVQPAPDLDFDKGIKEAKERKQTGDKYETPAPKSYESVKADIEPKLAEYQHAINQLTVLVDKYNSIFGEVGAHLTKDVEAKFKAVQDEIKAHKIKLDKIYNQITNILIQASRDDEKKLMQEVVSRHEEIRGGEAVELKKLDLRFGVLNPALEEIMTHLHKYKDIIREFESAVNDFEASVDSNDAKGIDRAIGTGKDGEGTIGACFKRVDSLQEHFLQPAFKKIPNDDLKDIFDKNPDKLMYENQRKALGARIVEIKERLARKNKQFDTEPTPLPDSKAEALYSNQDFEDFAEKYGNAPYAEAKRAFELLQTTISNFRAFYRDKIEKDTRRKPDASDLLAINQGFERGLMHDGVGMLEKMNQRLDVFKRCEVAIANLEKQFGGYSSEKMRARLSELENEAGTYQARYDDFNKKYPAASYQNFDESIRSAWASAVKEYQDIEAKIGSVEEAEQLKTKVEASLDILRGAIFAYSESFRIATELTVKRIVGELSGNTDIGKIEDDLTKLRELSKKPEYKRVAFDDLIDSMVNRLMKAVAQPIKEALRLFEKSGANPAMIRQVIDAHPRGREVAGPAINESIARLKNDPAGARKMEFLERLKAELGI